MSEYKLTGYELSRDFFDWCFENPDLIRPVHIAIYMFAIEHCNRLGWKPKFGFPTQMTMDAIGIKNWRTYIKSFNDLCDWGFFTLHEKSKNQYSANVIAIVKNTKAHTKALSKAQQKHIQKHSKSIVDINKLYNNRTIKPITYQQKLLSELNSSDFKDENIDYFEIAFSFFELFKSNLLNAGASTKNLEQAKGTWIDDIRLIITKDGYSKNDLREIFKFLQHNAFWAKNIRSTSKLREQMDTLKLQIHSENGKVKRNHGEATSWEELAAIQEQAGKLLADKNSQQ